MGDETIPQGSDDPKTRINEIAHSDAQHTITIMVDLPADLILRMDYFTDAHNMTRDGLLRAALIVTLDLYNSVEEK